MYGFIIKDDDGEDIFFHYNNISDSMLKNIIANGQNVTFGILKDEKGEKAINIKLIL